MGMVSGIDTAVSAGSKTSAGGGEKAVPRWSRKVAVDLVAILDVLAVLVSSSITSYLHESLGLVVEGGEYSSFQSALIVAVITHFMLVRGKMYDTVAMGHFPLDPVRICAAFLVGLLVLWSLFIAFGIYENYPLSWIPIWFLIGFALLIFERSFVQWFFTTRVREGYFRANLAVYGGGIISKKLHDHLLNEVDGIRFLGVFDDRQNDERIDTCGLKLSGDLNDLIQMGRDGLVDQIIIALPQSAGLRINEIARKLEQLPVHINVCTHLASDVVDSALRGKDLSAIGPVGLLKIKQKPISDWGPFLKRMEDYCFASVMLVMSLPLAALIALAIKATSKGPVFFIQKRHGLNHQVINVFKFRTMRVMENGPEVRQVEKNDSRVTSIGKFLRRTSLDELPQLINILKGEMSLVGPRPHALAHNEEYGERLERYSNRHQVKPGITGWAQVNGFRGETKDHDLMKLRVMHDLHYITNWSFWFDMKIILMTPIYGMINRNAY